MVERIVNSHKHPFFTFPVYFNNPLIELSKCKKKQLKVLHQIDSMFFIRGFGRGNGLDISACNTGRLIPHACSVSLYKL